MPKIIPTEKTLSRKLGKLPYKPREGTLKFAAYADNLPTPPNAYYWGHHVKGWGMLGNNTVGDCTVAAAGHMLEIWTSAGNRPETVVTTDQALAAYSAITGYKPDDPNSDTGAEISDVLEYWKNIGVAGNKIAAYTQVAIGNHTEIMQAIELFGGVDIGVNLPLVTQNQGTHWVGPTGALTGDWVAGSWGGHSIVLQGYNANAAFGVSWGEVVTIDWSWLAAYLEESWAIVDASFFTGNYKPNGFDFAQLEADVKEV